MSPPMNMTMTVEVTQTPARGVGGLLWQASVVMAESMSVLLRDLVELKTTESPIPTPAQTLTQTTQKTQTTQTNVDRHNGGGTVVILVMVIGVGGMLVMMIMMIMTLLVSQ